MPLTEERQGAESKECPYAPFFERIDHLDPKSLNDALLLEGVNIVVEERSTMELD